MCFTLAYSGSECDQSRNREERTGPDQTKVECRAGGSDKKRRTRHRSETE